jgi:heterodisulfide reductase subunit D
VFLSAKEKLETIRACRDCPMCHPVDMVAMVTGKESNTPRGRSMTLWGLETGLLSWDSEGVASILYQAFLDGLPQEWCEGNYDFDEMVIDGRKTLVAKGFAPAAVSSIALRIRETGNPYGIKEKGTTLLVGSSPASPPEVVIFLGSSARVQRPQTALALGKILRTLGISFEVLEDEADCGLLSYQLGDFKSAAEQAKKVADSLTRCRAKKLISLSAPAYRMFTTRYARLGAALPEGMNIVHVTEFLSELITQDRLTLKRKIGNKVTYHDPCCLARFTYVLDPPRKIVLALAGDNFAEMDWSGKKARSCGGCGGVPFTHPEISEKAARIRVEEALRTGARILTSADPECEHHLSGAVQEGEIEVKDLVELVADAL